MRPMPPPPPPPGHPTSSHPALPGLLAPAGAPPLRLVQPNQPVPTVLPPAATGSVHAAVYAKPGTLDDTLRSLMAESGMSAQRDRMALEAFNRELVGTLRLLAELDEQRRFLAERVALLEDRLLIVERLSANAADVALNRTEHLDHRISRVERSLATRIARHAPDAA